MGLLAVASAKGSPGVTTTSLLFGALWPRPVVVVEADPSGGDIALRMPDASGNNLDPQRGLVSLVAAGRRSFHGGLVREHSQQIVGGLDVVAGVSSPEQAGGVNQWHELSSLFTDLPGTDVVADLGRVGAATPQNVLMGMATAVVFVVDTLPSNVVHLRERLRRVHEMNGTLGAPLHVVVRAPAKRQRAVREVEEVLERAPTPLAGVHHLADDDTGAGFFLGQVRGNPARTALVRSAEPLVAALAERSEKFFVEREEVGDETDPATTDIEGGAA